MLSCGGAVLHVQIMTCDLLDFVFLYLSGFDAPFSGLHPFLLLSPGVHVEDVFLFHILHRLEGRVAVTYVFREIFFYASLVEVRWNGYLRRWP